MIVIRVWCEDKTTGEVISEAVVGSIEAVRAWITREKRLHGYEAMLEPEATWRDGNGRLVTFKTREL